MKKEYLEILITNFIYNLKKFFFISLVIPIFLGILSSFSLPPYNYIFLNFLVLPFFFLYLCSFSRNKNISFLIGWLFGFGYFFSSTYWISTSLTFEETYRILIPFSLIILPMFFGLFYGLATLLLSFLKVEKNIKSILIFSLIFSIIEFLRGSILTGFPWNLLVFSLTSFSNSIQILSYLGTYTLNLITITVFLFPVIIFFDFKISLKLISVISLIIALFLNNYFGSRKINEYNNISSKKLSMKINIISPKIEIGRYFSDEEPYKRLIEIVEISNAKNNDNGEIYIFPEGILVGINLNNLQNHKSIFKDNFSENDLIVIGMNSEENNRVYNSLVILNNNLDILGKYNKNNLVPFGEFLPFERLLSGIGLKKLTKGYRSFSSSNKRDLMNLNDLKFLPLICYEIIYTGNLSFYEKDYDFIINISEDGWFGQSIGPFQHLNHSIFRSIEEGKNILRSSNNGISGLIDPIGKLITLSKTTEGGVVIIDSIKYVETSYFSKHGNKIFFYFVIIYITLIFFLQRKDL